MVAELASAFVVAFTAIFFVVDPFSAVPVFLAMTRGADVRKRRETALRASVAAGIVLATFALAGEWIFRALGIGLPAFKIAGGVVLLLLALDMIRTQPSRTRITEGEVEAGSEKDDIAVVPLAMPLLAGPGSIATVVVLMGRARSQPVQGAVLLLCIGAVSLIAFLVMAGASRVDRVLGKTGLNILERASGLLLAAIAIQFLLDGVGEALPGLAHLR